MRICQRGPIADDPRRRNRVAPVIRVAARAAADDGRVRRLPRRPERCLDTLWTAGESVATCNLREFFRRAASVPGRSFLSRNCLPRQGLAATCAVRSFGTVGPYSAKVDVAQLGNRADTCSNRRGATRDCRGSRSSRPPPRGGARSADTPPPCPTVLCQSLFVVCNLARVRQTIARRTRRRFSDDLP